MLQLYETIFKQKYFKKTLFRKNNFGGITTLNLKKKKNYRALVTKTV